ncbi:hypothetical protein Bca4012_027701 [Brassica carinata]|uniref:RRM domain-containing protein n=1 Tax=Brassica carinata TaxID=52824 RepID=A0A8X7VKV1_BRACI|nr:hypothetical protein Bca52824_024684 [Brassica carinata]
MASCSQKANLSGKRRRPEDGLGTEPVLKKRKEKSEEKEIEARVELLSDIEANLLSIFGSYYGQETVDTEPILKDVGDVVSVRLIVDHEGKHVGCGFVEFASSNQAKKALENKNGKYLHNHKILLMKRSDETPNFSEAIATVRNKTICVTHFSGQTKISDIINFFKDVGQVVHVLLIVNPKIKHVKALAKNAEYLYDRDIFLDFVKEATYTILSRVFDILGKKTTHLIEEHAAAETTDFVEDANLMKTTVFFASRSMKKDKCSMSNIIYIFKCVGEAVHVRLIVDHRGESLGCGFAVQEKSGRAIYVKVAEKAPYLFRPKCNLADLAEKLWYEDKLRREGFGLPSKSELGKEEAVFCGKKITFFDKD